MNISQLALVVKNPPADSGDVRDLDLSPSDERRNGPSFSQMKKQRFPPRKAGH